MPKEAQLSPLHPNITNHSSADSPVYNLEKGAPGFSTSEQQTVAQALLFPGLAKSDVVDGLKIGPIKLGSSKNNEAPPPLTLEEQIAAAEAAHKKALKGPSISEMNRTKDILDALLKQRP